jgi:hypothetical protein
VLTVDNERIADGGLERVLKDPWPNAIPGFIVWLSTARSSTLVASIEISTRRRSAISRSRLSAPIYVYGRAA